MAYDNFSNILSSIKRQSAAVSGRPSTSGTVSGVLSGVAAGADSRVANKRNLEMQGRQADIQQQGQDLNVQRFAEEKRQSDIELQMAHEAALRNTKQQRSNNVSSGVGTVASIAAAKYLGGGGGAYTAVPSVKISTVGSGGTGGGGAGGGGVSGSGTGGGGMSTAAPVAFAAYAALMTGMSVAALRQTSARKAENQRIDSLGGMTADPEQNRRYAERRQQEYAEINRRMMDAYPGSQPTPSPDNYYAVGPVDMGRNRYLYGTDYEPPPEFRAEKIRQWAIEQGR